MCREAPRAVLELESYGKHCLTASPCICMHIYICLYMLCCVRATLLPHGRWQDIPEGLRGTISTGNKISLLIVIHTYIHIYMRLFIHAYIHTYIHTLFLPIIAFVSVVWQGWPGLPLRLCSWPHGPCHVAHLVWQIAGLRHHILRYHTYIRVYIHTYIHVVISTYIHLVVEYFALDLIMQDGRCIGVTCINMVRLHTYSYIHTYIHTYILELIHSCMHTYIHTYIHIYIHLNCRRMELSTGSEPTILC